ncbi:MAG: DUF3050 domain-containing protein [Chromatiales bacterium]|nr:DUF3050 domain-containing protein [Chromatiales bacterium]
MSFEVTDLREQLVDHPLYRHLNDETSLRIFMQAHVFCVWDFQSLLKDLQRRFTYVGVPWLPTEDGEAARLVNEIVLEEESDEHPTRGYASHYQLYLDAMRNCGAKTHAIEGFHQALGAGQSLSTAMQSAEVSPAVQNFVATTFRTIAAEGDHRAVSVFTHGREDLLPDIFIKLVESLSQDAPEQWGMFLHYLNRHIEVDGERHGPISHALLARVCGSDAQKWHEAETSAREALEARIRLWDALLLEIQSAEAKA